MLSNKMNFPACPYTVKEFSSKQGQYCLKSDCIVNLNNYTPRYLKLYKKENIDGLDTFRLIAQKRENKLFKGMDITKDLFNSAGELIEQSHIRFDKFHKNIDVQGKSFKMNRPMELGLRSSNGSDFKITMGLDSSITPMVKRVLKLISNMK